MVRSLALVLCTYGAAAIFSLSAGAEEMLEKGSSRFLGWQTSKTEFTTCDKNPMPIETGRVLKTIAKCQGPVFAVDEKTFTVTAIDTDNRMLHVVDKKGAPWNVYYPEVAEKPNSLKFGWLKPGQEIGVDYLDPKMSSDRVLRAQTVKATNK